jgi:adenylate kinase family enzyme
MTTNSIAEMNFVPIDHPLGNRISIVGNGGKTTLALALNRKKQLPFIEMDAVFWKPNWGESTAEEMIAGMNAAIDAAPDGWIIDGHYWSKVDDLVLRQADMVIWLDLPWGVMFWRMLVRSFRRARDKNKICGENTESWRRWLTRDALWWYWVTNRSTFKQRHERLKRLVPRDTPVIRLRSAAELDAFYEVQGLSRATN